MEQSSNNAVVYGLFRLSNPAIRYVGITTRSAEVRFKGHQKEARLKLRPYPLYDWMRKYDDVTFVILHDGLTRDEACALEMHEIASRSNLLNLTKGGDGINGYVFTDEVKAKMSAHFKGKPLSAATKSKMSASKKGIAKPKIQCPNCGFIGGGAMHRWHFDNCGKPSPYKGQSKPKIECPHCGKLGGGGAMVQFHFDNCKLKAKA